MQSDLVFDVGLHMGEDTAFYLNKGFRVVAIEADPELCERAAKRFAEAIRDGRLTLLNKALARKHGLVTFYRNLDISVWGTTDPEWVERNSRFRTRSEPIAVEATTMPELLSWFGTPYYLKLDIEGSDMIGLEGLATTPVRPKYVSIESDKDSFKALRREIQTFATLGYDRFKIVNQEQVPSQVPPNPPREGKFCDYQFEYGASGLFGEEAPGEWLTIEQVIDAYRPVFLRYALTGDDPFVRSVLIQRVLKRLGFKSSWYDTHARLCAN